MSVRQDSLPMLLLKYLEIGNWIEISDVLSSIHLCEVQLSNCVCQIVGITNLGYLLRIFTIRLKRFNTPWVGTIHRDHN